MSLQSAGAKRFPRSSRSRSAASDPRWTCGATKFIPWIEVAEWRGNERAGATAPAFSSISASRSDDRGKKKGVRLGKPGGLAPYALAPGGESGAVPAVMATFEQGTRVATPNGRRYFLELRSISYPLPQFGNGRIAADAPKPSETTSDHHSPPGSSRDCNPNRFPVIAGCPSIWTWGSLNRVVIKPR